MSIRLNRSVFYIELLLTGQEKANRGSSIVFGKNSEGKLFSVLIRDNVLARLPEIGESWKFRGEWDTNKKYPNQIIAESGEPIFVTGERLSEYIIRHPRLRVGNRNTRIGKETWKNAIIAAKGSDKLSQLLDNEDKKSIKALGIGRLTYNIDEIIMNWSILQGELKGIKLLEKHNVNKSLSKKLVKYYGERVPELLETDCFRLLAYDKNTKKLFKSCEHIADAMGYPENDHRRLQGAVDFILNYRLDNFNHTAITYKTLLKALLKIFKDEKSAKKAIDNALNSGAISKAWNGLLQSRPIFFVQSNLEHRFVDMLTTYTKEDEILGIDASLKAKLIFPQARHTLTQEQKYAIELPFNSRLSIITGFAGSGKTTVISSIIRLASLLDITVYQTALSGQATHVMKCYNDTHEIKCIARTIHSYILPFEADEDREPSFQFKENGLIIIDEASMVDISLMNRLIKILPKNIRMLMVGDPNQIAPVGAGLVFHLLCKSERMPIAHLTKIHRSSAKTGIPDISNQIRKGIPPVLPLFEFKKPTPEHGVFFLPAYIDRNDKDSLAKVLFKVASKLGINNTQIITTHRKKSNQFGILPASIHYINDYFQKQLTSGKRKSLKVWGFNEGDPVLVRKNMINIGGVKGFDLFNGNIGTLTSAERPYQFQFNNHFHELDDDDIAKLGIQLGYGLTAHSFQGSSSDCIVIAVTRSNLLDRSLLYTALTRAKKTCVFVGNVKAFENAVREQPKWKRICTAFSIDRYFE